MKVAPKRSLGIRAKYAVDRLVGAGLLVAVAPVLGVLAAAVKLEDGGPAFFVQPRPGLGGAPFSCYKLRTMIVDADRYIDADGRPTRSRITRVGRVLRKTSLDELPQLINLAKGDMSLIGPRPPLMIHLRRYDATHMQRFRMKPGVTGWAQVNGRNTIKWSRRIELDNEYIDNWSPLLDVKIALKTALMVVKRDGIVEDRNPQDVDDLPPPRPLADGEAA
jgi:lipopolysaccharide/colanic/teichoic acid biosynthesis glycosyltransferase